MEKVSHGTLNEVALEDKIDLLRLIRTENVGIVTFYNLLKLYKTPGNALENISHLAKRGGIKRPIELYSKSQAEDELDKILSYGAQIVTIFDSNYPPLLKHIADPPPILTVKGNISLCNNRCIAMVGSRNASVNGARLAYKFAKELGEAGYIIVSGLARGIDTAIHQASIDFGTIAVIAGGIDNIYPRENAKLYQEISEKGLLITEIGYGEEPKSQNFPRRNRIISGISLATLIIEATLKSGSLITARYANEQGRDVLAIPGFPFEPRSQGTNHLIQNGAYLITSVQDVLDITTNYDKNYIKYESNENYTNNANKIEESNLSESELNQVRDMLIKRLTYDPITIDEIIESTSLNYKLIILAITELELAGKLIRYPGGKIALIFEDK